MIWTIQRAIWTVDIVEAVVTKIAGIAQSEPISLVRSLWRYVFRTISLR